MITASSVVLIVIRIFNTTVIIPVIITAVPVTAAAAKIIRSLSLPAIAIAVATR